MIFYYEKNTDRFILATNIRAVSEFSGISYHKIRGWFTNGSSVYKDDDVLCISADIVRGKQRLTKKDVPLSDYQKERIETMIKEGRVFVESKGLTGPNGPGPHPAGETDDWINQTGPGCPIGPKGTEGLPGLPKRETKQPKSRNMDEFDDFFKEVK